MNWKFYQGVVLAGSFVVFTILAFYLQMPVDVKSLLADLKGRAQQSPAVEKSYNSKEVKCKKNRLRPTYYCSMD